MVGSQTLEAPGYQVIQFLGSGARSTIWQVRDQKSGQVLALKRVVRRHAGDYKFMEQAINEYEVGSTINHPGIRRILGIKRIKRLFSLREIRLLMELVEGKSVQESRPDDIGEIVRIFCEVAVSLAHLNGRGFVHADMKPNNIILCPDGHVKIIDLGQSCRVGTIKERIQGTPDFMAPEQVHRLPLDGRTDVFNFGAALYWTLTGRPIPTIMPKKDQVGLMKDLSVTPPEQYNPQVPASLSQLLLNCIEMMPSRRPATMNEVSSRLILISKTLGKSGTLNGIGAPGARRPV
jgi:serine/threonine-protein kinase